jgi:hypothetical protein
MTVRAKKLTFNPFVVNEIQILSLYAPGLMHASLISVLGSLSGSCRYVVLLGDGLRTGADRIRAVFMVSVRSGGLVMFDALWYRSGVQKGDWIELRRL